MRSRLCGGGFVAALALAGFCGFAESAAPKESPDNSARLAAIKAKMADNLRTVPNYTCLETIVRWQRTPTHSRFILNVRPAPLRKIDVLRLDVALIDGAELFARPGAGNFDVKTLPDIGAGALMGRGSYVLLARDIFTTDSAEFQFAGFETVEGRKLVRYDFRVPQPVSRYVVTTPYAVAVAGYHGSLWADPQNLEVTRIEVTTDEIAYTTRIAEIVDRIDYAPVRLSESRAILPQDEVMTLRPIAEGESRNEIAFTHCRSYSADSSVSFEGGPDAARPAPQARLRIPEGLAIDMRLESAVDSVQSQVGDTLTGRVQKNVVGEGRVLVPRGALVTGRLRSVRKDQASVTAALEFVRIEFSGITSRLFAELDRIDVPHHASDVRKVPNPDVLGVAMISASSGHLVLPAGTRLRWITR